MMKINDMGKQQGTVCIDLSQPQSHYTKMTLATNIAIVFTNKPPKGQGQEWMIEFVQDGEGGKTVTFPASLTTTPKINLEPNAVSAITFYMEDGNNIEAQSQTENKIEIKEEDFNITIDGVLIKYNSKIIPIILQNQEDAKECREFHYREHQAKKDRQMIEKIKECLKNVHFTDEGEVLIKQIEDIFEEKK